MSNGLPSPEEVLGKGSSLPSPEQVLGVKKKDLSASGSVEPSSGRLTTTTTKATVSSFSKGKRDGVYSFPGQDNVIYKKEDGQWFKASKSDYKYFPLSKGNVDERIASLEKNAVSLEQYGFETEPRKEEPVKYQALPKAKPIAKPKTEAQQREQELFETSFKALEKTDPEYLRRKAQSDAIDAKVNQINADFINDNEEDVVPKVQQLIKDYPYLQVNQSGAGYDELEIVNTVTNERKKINLENWTSDRDKEEAKRLSGFLDVQMTSKDYVNQYQKVKKIKEQMQSATPTQRIELSQKLLEEQAKLQDLSNGRYNYVKNDKYKSSAIYDKNAKENIKVDFAKLQLQSIDYEEKAKSYAEWNKTVTEAREKGLITEEQYQNDYLPKLAQEKNMLIDERNKINEDFRQTQYNSTSIDRIAADEFAIQAERGNILTGTTYSFLQGAENSLRFLLETGDFQDGEFKGLLTDIAPGSISDIYTSAEGRNIFEQIIFGLANSGGSALVGTAAGSSFLGLYASSYVNMKDQMSGPEFADVTEYQKILMSGAYGATVGLLEKYGMSKWFSKTKAGKGLTNWILKRTIIEIGKDASSEAIELAVKKNLNAAITNGLIQVTSAGLVEGSTELAQEAADMVYKDVFNKMSEKEYFKNPKSWAEVGQRLSKSFILGFAGGAGMQSITQTLQVASGEMNKAQINNIEQLIDNPELKDTFRLNIKDQILSGQISKQEGKAIAERLNEVEGTLNKIPKNVDRFEAFKLINERDEIKKEIAGKDPDLVVVQTERVAEINEQLKQLSKDAVQKQTTSEVSVQPGAESGGEMAQGESQAGPQEVTQEGQQAQEEELKTINDRILKIEAANKRGELLEDSQPGELKRLKDRKKQLDQQAEASRIEADIETKKANIETRREEELAKLNDPFNLSRNIEVRDENGNLISPTEENINAKYDAEIAALEKTKAPIAETQEVEVGGIVRGFESISGNNNVGDLRNKIPQSTSGIEIVKGNDGNQYAVAFSRKGADGQVIFEQGASTPRSGYISASIKIEDGATEQQIQQAKQQAADRLNAILPTVKNGKIDKAAIQQVLSKNLQDTQKQTNLAADETGKPKAGNRLFNEPLKAVAEIANRYFQRVFGSQRPTFEGTTEFDVERAKRIASAYEAMEDNPNDPEVRRAYEAMAKETIDQYQDFLDAGYLVEINNEEPYANSADMIEDLRNNNRIKIFSTEAGFGDEPITPKQRAENPLLAITEFTDVNGQPMLVNDLFRAVHDFFGHAELGNSFGPKGEENAWNVHARMYSPLARRAMTTETRGQNSYVNFSGVNERVEALREQARKLRDEGKLDEAAAIVNQIYDEAKFAEQKIGLLPQEFSEVDQDNILTADTKDATNLQKVLDALDKIEKDLDQFGKETLGVNIPVALAKTIVKAVKALVKAGVSLEQAIKQIAAENNISEREVSSLLKPTKVSEIDVNEVRAKARPGKRISKGLSVKTVDRKKVIEETEDLSIEYVKKNAPNAFVSNANIIAKYPLVAGKKKFKTATTVEQAQEIYDVFVREVADNLNYLMAEFKPEYREISTLWYDGANAIANDFAAQFGVSSEQAAGIIAAMSPQKDWYQNVRLAEMVLMAYKDNPVMTKEMIEYQKGVNKKGLYDGAKSAGKKLKKAQKEYSEYRTKANKEALDEAKVKMQEAIEKSDAVITMLSKYIGQKLNEVPAFVQPYMVRTYHEVNTTKDYNIVAPDGSVQGVAKKNNGAKAKVAWGSYSEIGKAVAIKNDGSQENITRSLGERHKIRNFYNNIIDPMSQDGDVTMDTHAIAAALLLPLSGNSTQVDQNFGTGKGVSNSDPAGIKGLYYAYADAYALAAKEAGLLPRQVQSITWEAVRGLYTDSFKRDKAEVTKINNIWKDYQDGKITIDEAREQAKQSAGGIKDPTWAGPVQAEPGDGTGAQGVKRRGDGNERDTVGGTDGRGILTADTKNPTVLRKVESILNKADEDLAKFGRETLGINIPVATMRAIIKLAKVLVKTGITLQDAIIQAAEQKNVSKKDALNAIKFMTETINRPVEKVTVNKVTALKDQIRLEARAAREGAKSVSQAVKAITAFFKDKANQVNLTRAELKSVINIISSVKDQKTLDAAADKIYKIVSSAKSDVVEVNQMQALKSQIRLEAKAAREAKGDLNTKRKALAAAITGMVRQGKITAVQARSIINKVSRVNLDNPVMVERLISYAERVFDRADYQETLSKAAKIRKSIKKAMKSKDLQAEVAAVAKKFSSVDPFMVEDIDQYIENAEKMLNAVRPVRETEVPLRQATDIYAISDYTTAEVERQEANKKAELLALNKYLVEAGIVTDDMTAKEIQEMIDIISAEEYEVENADKKLNFLKNRFEFMSGVIEEMIVNERDIFTDEPLYLTQNEKQLMSEVLKFDIDKLSVKQAAQVLEAMDNFINNGITSGLEAVVKGYIGNENANKLAASGLKSRPLKMYWNKAVGKFFGEQFVSLPLLVERMFPGMKKGLKLMSEMGLTDVIRGAAKADREHKMIVKDYTNQEFYKGKGFMKAENVYERGMIAFLSRNLAGTKTEMRNEFLRRVKMIEESINALMTGSDTERKMGEAYQEVFDKLKVSSQDLDVIKANAEQMNLDAVNWMTQQWAEKYSDLSDISLSVYNAILGSDTNYTPDRYKVLDESDIELDEKLLERGSAFMGGLEYTDKNKSGVLIETTRPKVLPKGRFVSLDFDVNNFSSLKGAMIDIETAPAIRQVDGFIKSDGYKRIVNGDDRKILTSRINNYIIAVKGKTTFNRDSMKSVERLANFLGSLGVGKALGGLDQTVKQTAPVIINTLINAGRFDGLNFEMNAAINRSGMPIANRGIEAISGVESIDALIDKKGSTAAEIAKAIEKVSQMYMKILLSKPDVWVARSSFISYYKNYLKTNGMSTNIDWETHQWNQDAMNYAQMMVDRQQNISDEKLAGKLLSSPKSGAVIFRKVMLPFATFIINQKNRMHNDLIALFGIGAETSIEDKKRAARSLVGLSAEMLAYQAIAYFIKTMIYDNIAAWITGEDDEEEKKERSFFGIKMTKKQWNATKFPVKSLVSDVLSPFPLLDDAVVFGFDELMSNFPMISKEDIDKAIQDQNDARALKGQDPMDVEQEAKFIKNLKDKNTYAVTFQKESLGRQYGVPGIAFDTYTELADMAQLAYTGEFEDDMGFGPKKKYISKKDQELVKWTLLPMVLYSTGLVPKDAGVISRKVVATVKKRSISETKFNNTNELKTELGRKPKDWEESLVMNTTKKVPTLVEAIKFAERFGGLTESQGKEYAKLIEITGDYGYLDLKRIQEGETADQILKK
jgi:hypothetical protein